MNDFHTHMNDVAKKLENSVDSYPEYSASDFELLPFLQSSALHTGEFNPPRVTPMYSNDASRPVKNWIERDSVEAVGNRKSTYLGTVITQEANNIVGVTVTVSHKYKFRKLVQKDA